MEAPQALQVSGAVEPVASVSLSSASTLYGVPSHSFGTTVDVQLADGTQYNNAHSLGWLPAAGLVEYASDAGAVTTQLDGDLVLQANHEELVTITAQTCDGGSGASDSVSVAANLKAGVRGVDLGLNVGLQFVESGGVVQVPVLVNSGAQKLVGFQLTVEFAETLLLASGHSETMHPESEAGAVFSGTSVTLNNPVDQALLVGDKDGSVAPSGMVQLVDLQLTAQGSGVTLITATVTGLIT